MPLFDFTMLDYLYRTFARDLEEYSKRPRQPSERAWYDPAAILEPALEWRGRVTFFEKVQTVAPEAVGYLREQVLPCMERTDSRLRRPSNPVEGGGGFVLPAFWPDEPRTLLEKWAKTYSLSDAWAVEVGAMTICRWITGVQTDRDRFHFDWTAYRGSEALKSQFIHAQQHNLEITLPGWNMCVDWSVYEREMVELMKAWLRRYQVACERHMENHGWTKIQRKRVRSGNTPDLHFEWLAHWQVRRWTHKRIAREHSKRNRHSVSEKTVQAACRKTAEEIGLTRRSL